MTRNVPSVTPSTGTRKCTALMSEKKIRHLPVIDGHTVLGMISIRDILDDIVANHEATIAQLENYIRSQQPASDSQAIFGGQLCVSS